MARTARTQPVITKRRGLSQKAPRIIKRRVTVTAPKPKRRAASSPKRQELRNQVVTAASPSGESATENTSRETDKSWQIDAFMLGDGSTVAGLKLEKNCWYASARHDGGAESYFRIHEESITTPTSEGRIVSYNTKAIAARNGAGVVLGSCPVPEPKSTRLQRAGNFGHVALGAAKNFCRKNPGVAVITARPGAREANSELSSFFMPNVDDPSESSRGLDCLAAATVNCAYSILGTVVAAELFCMFAVSKQHFPSLGQVRPFVRGMKLKLNLRKPKNVATIREQKFSGAFEDIAAMKNGRWLVRLMQAVEPRVDHCVFVDATKGVIVDSAVDHPIHLCADTLYMCGGPNRHHLFVAEVLEVFKW